MTPNNLPISRSDAGQQPGPAQHTSNEARLNDQMLIAELRRELSELGESFTQIAETRTARIQKFAGETTASLRSNIEAHPWTSVGLAAAAGAIVALAVVPKTPRSSRAYTAASFNADDIAASVRGAMSRVVNTEPIASRFERVMDSISKIDTTSLTSSPAYETAKTWLQSAVNAGRNL